MIEEDSIIPTGSLLLIPGESVPSSKESRDDITVLEFVDHAKVDRIPKVVLPLVITATIVNHFVSGIYVDNKSSCNILYLKKKFQTQPDEMRFEVIQRLKPTYL